MEYKLQKGRSLDEPESQELVAQGKREIQIAESEMPGVHALVKEYAPQKPLKGAHISGCLHLTIETAVLIRAFKALGADVRWCSCNIFSTHDPAAYLMASEGIPVFAWKGMTESEYWWCVEKALGDSPDIVIDDGGDMTAFVLDKTNFKLKGVAEETTTGVRLLKKRGQLPFPAIAVNDLITKSKFDNHYGCRESLLAGLMQGTHIMLGGKVAVLSGFGDVGKGCAEALKGLGCRVIITEIDPIAAYQAIMDGFEVMTMDLAAPIGDLFITATGCIDVIRGEHLESMKDGALLANIGHFDTEIDVSYLKNSPHIIRENIKPLVDRYVWKDSKKSVIVLSEGRLVNLSLAKGHPSFVMSNSFSGQILAAIELWQNKYPPGIHRLPRILDEKIARVHVDALGGKLTHLTEKQANYLGISKNGPFLFS